VFKLAALLAFATREFGQEVFVNLPEQIAGGLHRLLERLGNILLLRQIQQVLIARMIGSGGKAVGELFQ